MKFTKTKPGSTAWLGAGALAGLLMIGAPNTIEAQDTSAVKQDTTQRAAADTARSDTTQWGRTADQEAEVQNPPGYRGMERPVNVFPPDTTDTSSAGDATSRVEQLKRQDSIAAAGDTARNVEKNPPGYRGMERPVGTDTLSAEQMDAEFIGTSTKSSVRAKWRALLKAAVNQPNPSRDLQDAITNLRKEGSGKAQKTEKTGTKKKATTTKKQTTTTQDTSRQQTEMRQQSRSGSDTASTVRAGQDTTGDTTRFEVNAQEGRSAAGRTGEKNRDTTDVVHRERETPPGMGYEPPAYPSDSEQVWVEQQPSGDSVTIGFDSTASKQDGSGN